MNITLSFDNYNGGTEDGVHVYRDIAPIPDTPLPTPLATLAAGSVSYVDSTVIRGTKYYYRFGIFKGSDELLSPNKVVRAVAPSDTGPGPQQLTMGDWDLGFFGLTKSSDLVTYVALANFLGLTTGSAVTDYDWLKFAYKGKVLFVAKAAARYNLTYASIYVAGGVYGTNDNGLAVPTGSVATNQYKPLIIGSWTVLPRIMKGLPDNGTKPADRGIALQATALPSNEFDDVIGSICNDAKYTGDTNYGYFGRFDADLTTPLTAGQGISDYCQQTSGFTDLTNTILRGGRNAGTAAMSPASLFACLVTGVNSSSALWTGSSMTIFGGWRPVLELVL